MTMQMSIPSEERAAYAPASIGGRARAWWKLFLIELRRSPALYAALLVAAVTAWMMWDRLPVGVVRWREVNLSASDAIIPGSAIAAGISASIAGRDERLRLDDQLAQTTFGQVRHDVLALLATFVWCLAGYLVPVTGFFTYTSVKATWAGPAWGYVGMTLISIVLGVSGGWFVGTVWRNRLSVLVAVAGMLAVHGFYPLSYRFRMADYRAPDGSTYQASVDAWYKNLLPMELLDYHDLAFVMWWGAVWVVGLSMLALSVSWWWRHRPVVALVGISVAALVSGTAAAELALQEPEHWAQRQAEVYVEPVCVERLDGQIEICVHPQNAALLDDTAAVIEPLVAPVAKIQSVPTRFEEQQGRPPGPDTVYFYVHDAEDLDYYVKSSLLRELMNDPSQQMPYQTGSAQYVVLAWLLQEAGVTREEATAKHYLPPLPFVHGIDSAIAAGATDPMEINRYLETTVQGRRDIEVFRSKIDAAVHRFASLPDAERRAWLEANWDALRANELTLEDLP